MIRTTAFKLIAAYLLAFAIFAASIIAYLGWHTQRLVVGQVTDAIETEAKILSQQYTIGGVNRLASIINRRSRQPGAGLYLLTTFTGENVAGNVLNLPLNFLDSEGWKEIDYVRSEDTDGHTSRAVVKVIFLPGEFRLLIGRDVVEREELRRIIIRPALWSVAVLVLLGVAGGLFVTRRVLKRIDEMTATSDRIMAGDLTGRLPLAGTDDEFDRLALSVNAMLERIEVLLAGLKQVSDNIAHDLKTPLTRLRNRAEDALRTASTDVQWRAATEQTIEESDTLIRIFDALLMIARAEAGQARAGMVPFDLAETVESVAELYEPLAEEKGLSFEVTAQGPLMVRGVRELIGQALSNLVDNAIKYSCPDEEDGVSRTIRIAGEPIGERARITVADQGAGIPELDRARVLERFVRLEASRTRPGSGLGLSLVSAVVHLHGGTLALEDNAPGLRIVIELPLEPVSGD
nr:ATP-binding protein [Ancylobacter crimeensis]